MSKDSFKRFAQHVLKETVPGIANSAYVMAIAPPTGAEADVRQAVEIGFAILMDKPLIVICPKGRHVGERLLRIADHIIEADITTEEGRVELAEKMKAIIQ
jgi:hypothetical protein